MKNILSLLLVIAGIGTSEVLAQASLDTLTIHTSVVCSTCKKRIENDLVFESGIKQVNVDVDQKTVRVVYQPKKTDPEKIRLAVTRIGYDADSLKADPKAFRRLPDCCKSHDADHPH